MCLLSSNGQFHKDTMLLLNLILSSDGEWKLLLVTQASCVGDLPQGGRVYCIDRIAIVPLSTDSSPSDIIGLEVRNVWVFLIHCNNT